MWLVSVTWSQNGESALLYCSHSDGFGKLMYGVRYQGLSSYRGHGFLVLPRRPLSFVEGLHVDVEKDEGNLAKML